MNLTASIMRLHQFLNSASPRAINAVIAFGFASSDYCINLHWAAPRAINGVIALYAVRFAYIWGWIVKSNCQMIWPKLVND